MNFLNYLVAENFSLTLNKHVNVKFNIYEEEIFFVPIST
jgi:hypothetical protein